MIASTVNFIRQSVNRSPQLKRFLIRVLNFMLECRKIAAGTITRNPAYTKHLFNSSVIAKPGTLSFAGGVFNPGALILDNDTILLLAKSQEVPWFKARGNKRHLFMAGKPIIFRLDRKTGKILHQKAIEQVFDYHSYTDWAIEDLRIFYFNGQILCNHSFITKSTQQDAVSQNAVYPTLSFLDEKQDRLQFLAFPKVDFETKEIEKNWMYVQSGQDLLLFYSLYPYRVLKLVDQQQMKFETLIHRSDYSKLKDPGGFGTMLSFSANPIDFDENHWMTVVHQIKHKWSGRCYYHWVLLIDKTTFLPTKMSRVPVFSGMGARGRSPGIRYISAILKEKEELLFFAGEGDVYTTVTRKKISTIVKHLIDL